MSFEEAREFVKSLRLSTKDAWSSYVRSGNKPKNIPSNPRETYKLKGWISWGDWLGTDNIRPADREYRSFEEARYHVRSLKLKNWKAWITFCKSGHKPKDIPANPRQVYGKSFVSASDWLGNNNKRFSKVGFRSFVDARSFVHDLNLGSWSEWKAYCQSGDRPFDIPVCPNVAYPNEFKSAQDWLGYNEHWKRRKFLPFVKARMVVRGLRLGSNKEWKEYHKANAIKNIPICPDQTYVDEWVSWMDFLGKEYLSFEEARAFIHNLSLSGQDAWRAYCRSGNKPKNIPTDPVQVYKSNWKSWGDWFGNGNIHNRELTFLSFVEARTIAQSLGIKSGTEWNEWSKNKKLPKGLPSNPNSIYRDKGWISWGDWLGTNSVASQKKEFVSYDEFIAILREEQANGRPLKTKEDYQRWSQQDDFPSNLPKAPDHYYSKNE